ncbi:hypothetical protein YC2023_093774 [Brassica napus]
MAHCKDKDKEHGDSDSTAKLSQIAFQIKGGRRWKLESVYGIIEGGDKREKARIWALGGDCREKSPILSWPTPAQQESCINKKETRGGHGFRIIRNKDTRARQIERDQENQ